MGGAPLFRLFGFPIHVRPGFVLFMLLVVVVNGGPLGLWIAGSAAVLTLVHELGHAFAARATGANAEISLDLFAGYASFVPVRPLKRWERAGISISGPAVQIGMGTAALMLMGVNPLDSDSFGRSDAALAIWWTGPVLGLFNLVPVLPLDGGHIVLAALDRVVGARSRILMLWFSIAVTGGAAVWFLIDAERKGLAVFVLFPLMIQLQMLTAGSDERRSAARRRGAEGEAAAWREGDVDRVPPGLVPSPWYRAHQQLRAGHPDVARDVLLADFGERGPVNWWPPHAAPADALAPLVELLPRPLPHGRLPSDLALAEILLRLGRAEDAAAYAAEIYADDPSTEAALVIARAAGSLGDVDTAVGWLRAAFDAGTNLPGLEAAVDFAPELVSVRTDPRLAELRARLTA